MATNDSIQRQVLPIPDRKPVSLTTYDAKDPDTKFPPITPLRPPRGAPNVLVILLDDVGFGASSAFGGPCQTPTAERLAREGLKYIRFHTTALCSPSRAALLSGRNHHAVGMGGITEIATSAPGYNSLRPNTCAPLAEILKLNGYSTAQFGKCHEVPVFEATPIEAERTADEGYHLTEDLADKAIGYIRQQKAVAPDKPFFVYFAPGAAHAPHHVAKEWADKYKGKFDHGWDRQREITFENQKKIGMIPKDTKLTPRPDSIPSWESRSADEKRLYARMQEVFAGFHEHVDAQVGKVVDAIETLGLRDDTLIIYVVGDNGASGEGSLTGTLNNMKTQLGLLDDVSFMLEHIEELGGPLHE